jgi:hypothetical protein
MDPRHAQPLAGRVLRIVRDHILLDMHLAVYGLIRPPFVRSFCHCSTKFSRALRMTVMVGRSMSRPSLLVRQSDALEGFIARRGQQWHGTYPMSGKALLRHSCLGLREDFVSPPPTIASGLTRVVVVENSGLSGGTGISDVDVIAAC